MSFLATLAFLEFGCSTFAVLIKQREDPNHALTVAHSVDDWVLRRKRADHYVSSGLINGHPVRFLLDTGAMHTAAPAYLSLRLGLTAGVSSRVSTANGTVVGRATTIER